MAIRPTVQEQPANEEDLQRIREILADMETAVAERDAAKVDSRFTADVVFTTPAGQRFIGWEEIHAYHEEQLARPVGGFRTWYTVERVTFPSPEVAVVCVRQPVTTADGRFANVGTWTLVKKDGAWWIHAIHNTNVATG